MTYKILYWDNASKTQKERDSTPEEDAQRAEDMAASDPVPQSVTRRQGLQALLLQGVTEAMIEMEIDALPIPASDKALALIEFRASQEFHYDRPLVIQMAQIFELDREALFRTAASL